MLRYKIQTSQLIRDDDLGSRVAIKKEKFLDCLILSLQECIFYLNGMVNSHDWRISARKLLKQFRNYIQALKGTYGWVRLLEAFHFSCLATSQPIFISMWWKLASFPLGPETDEAIFQQEGAIEKCKKSHASWLFAWGHFKQRRLRKESYDSQWPNHFHQRIAQIIMPDLCQKLWTCVQNCSSSVEKYWAFKPAFLKKINLYHFIFWNTYQQKL